MMNNTQYNKWKKLYQDQKFLEFNTKEALLWLKVRAISKKASLSGFLEKNDIHLTSTMISGQNEELFAELAKTPESALEMLDAYLCDINNEWYRELGVDENLLKKTSTKWIATNGAVTRTIL